MITKAEFGSFTDSRDGRKYKTVKVGKQVWTAENLSYNAKGSLCYVNEPASCAIYGRLYDWNTAKNVCPKGWHLPTYAEWQTIVDFVGKEIAGKKLKARSGWKDNNGKSGDGADEFGFSALPGGFGTADGGFKNFSDNGIWWNASERNANNAGYWHMNYDNEDAKGGSSNKDNLFSVRCLQD